MKKDDDGMGTVIDFNDALRQGQEQERDPFRVEKIKDAMNASAHSVLSHLFPEGGFAGDRFYVGDLQGNPGNSMIVELGSKLGLWKDFSAGDGGGDLLSLWQKKRGLSFPETLAEIEDYLRIGNTLPAKPRQIKPVDLPPPTKKWLYLDYDGKIIATHTRFDKPNGKKEFRPWDAIQKKATFPNPRPLYNLPGIKDASRVILVEGEKCADALIELGIQATTTMGGSNAPPEKTDWAPLSGKEVLIWPDNDEPGGKYAQNAAKAISHAGGKVLSILTIPTDKSAKWDAADAVQEGFDVQTFLSSALPYQKQYRISLSDWTIQAYQGEAPRREWLVDHVFPMGAASLMAAMGGSGKGMLGLHLALQVACEYQGDLLNPHPKAFGNDVLQRGTAVIFSAEDDHGEIHRRLEQIDPSSSRFASQGRLIVVPLPNTGGPSPIVVPGKNGPQATDFFLELKEQLLAINDLRLVIFDPLVNFAMVDINKDPGAGSFVNGLLSSLASETGAAVIVAHHLNKLGGDKAIHTPEQAREKIKGTTTVVDGVRSVYCLWAMEEGRAKSVCRKLGSEYVRNKVFSGSVVKANGPADMEVKTFVRQPNGLLMVVDEILRTTKVSNDDLLDALVETVKLAALAGRPFSAHGKSGFFERKDELSPELKDIGRDRLRRMTEELLEAVKIKKCIVQGQKNAQWLDVPDGPFWNGVGKFEPGFVAIYASNGKSATED